MRVWAAARREWRERTWSDEDLRDAEARLERAVGLEEVRNKS